MSDDLKATTHVVGRPIDPVEMARRDLKKSLPRRFYSQVAVVDRGKSFGLELDGKPVLTPAKAPLLLPTQALADLLADEWRAVEEWIDPDAMPCTRLVNTAIDGVAAFMDETAADVVKFAETDVVCYRTGEPDTLVAAQSKAWDPVLDFAHASLGVRFVCAEGMTYVAQPEAAHAAVGKAVDTIASGPSGPLRLAALSVMTNLTGSVLLALAVAHQALSAEAAWSAAHVDEDYQLQHWGTDAETLARRDLRWRDMRSAAMVYALAS